MIELDRYAVSLENMEVLRAQVEAQAREIERLQLTCNSLDDQNDRIYAELAALKVQMPIQGGEAVACWLKSSVPGADIVVLGSPDDIHQAATDTKILLYTHPADQVADGVVVSRELLDSLLTVIDSNGYAADEVEVVDDLRALLNGDQE